MPFAVRRFAWLIALGGLATVGDGCGSNSLSSPDGTAGTTGASGTGGGAAGTTGVGGTGGGAGIGGSGDAGPLCATPADISQSCVSATQSSALTSGPTPVMVTSVDTIASGSCPGNFTAVLDQTRRLVLRSAGQQQWTVYLRIPELPTDLIQVGDALDLSVSPYNGGTSIVLARGGSLVVFAYYYSYFMAPGLPDLTAFGIALSDGGVDCTATFGDCQLQGHRVHVTAAGASGDVERGQTAHIGGLSITVERYDFVQCFDPNQGVEISGFAIP